MEKTPNTDILGWYVNKLYKKALDHCLQQTTAVPAEGQVYRGHDHGHSDNFAKSPVCNSTLNGDLSKCARTIQKDDTYQCRKGQGQKSNFKSHDSRITEEVKQSKLTKNRIKLISTSREMCLKQPQSSRRLHENTILSESRHTVNKNSISNVCESDMTGNCSIGRQHVHETESCYLESSKLERFTMSNLKSKRGFYGQKDSCSQQGVLCIRSRPKYNECKLSQVVTHDLSTWGQRSQPPIFKETENVRNGRFEMPKSDIQTSKPNGTDLSWFRHSVQPQQTNIHLPFRQSSLSKDDDFLCRQNSPNTDPDHRMLKLIVPSHSYVNMERESNSLIPCQHSDSVHKGKWLSQTSCSHQHPAKIENKGSESTSPHQHSVDTNTQFLPSTTPNDRPVTNTSTDSEKTQTFKSSIFFSLKSNVNSNQGLLAEQSCTITEHCGNKDVQKNPEGAKSTGHSAQPQSHNICHVHPCNDILEPCKQKKPANECSSHSPKAVPDQANTDDTSRECLQSLEKEGTKIPFDPDEDQRLKTASGTLTTPPTSAASEDLSNCSHKDPPASEFKRDNSVVSVPYSAGVVPLTNENLKLHHVVLSGSSPRQDNGADSDSGESCKSGIVIKPGHSNQKRKRSLSLDKKGNKRRSSGTTKKRIQNPTTNRGTVNGNKKLTNVPGKISHNKKADKNSKIKKREKRVDDTHYPLRSCRRKPANVVKSKVEESKPTVKKKKKKNALKTFDKPNKKTPSGMSEHLKQCIGREISILKAHEDQAMSINSDSVCHSVDSKRLSSLAFLDLKDLAQVPEPCKALENQSVYMSKKHVGGVWNSIVKK